MPLKLQSPYSSNGLPWLKGNLHTHTSNSDGPGTPQALVDAYAALGYDFLMLSDHDCLSKPEGLDSRGMAIIPGNEITANGPHVLHVDARSVVPPHEDRQKVIDEISADGGLSIMCHPNWESHFNHCPQERLVALQGYAGIEIFNGVVTWLEGCPVSTDRWDRLLAQKRRIWGFAHDDCHRPEDVGIGWNVVQAERGNAADIVHALRTGRFYASSGVEIRRIDVEGNTVTLHAKDAHRISVFSDNARRRHFVDADVITYTLPEDAGFNYIRFECAGRGEERAWTQPFFIERDGPVPVDPGVMNG